MLDIPSITNISPNALINKTVAVNGFMIKTMPNINTIIDAINTWYHASQLYFFRVNDDCILQNDSITSNSPIIKGIKEANIIGLNTINRPNDINITDNIKNDTPSDPYVSEQKYA